MGVASFNNRERSDTLIGVMWAIGMALGIILIDMTPGYNVDLMSYLFGSILSVPNSDILVMVFLDVLIFLVIILFYKEFLALSYDEEFSFVVGIPVKLFYFILLGMIALSVVMIKAEGAFRAVLYGREASTCSSSQQEPTTSRLQRSLTTHSSSLINILRILL